MARVQPFCRLTVQHAALIWHLFRNTGSRRRLSALAVILRFGVQRDEMGWLQPCTPRGAGD